MDDLSDVTHVEAGWGYSCALTSSGRVYCWGFNGQGAVGIGSSDDMVLSPSEVAF